MQCLAVGQFVLEPGDKISGLRDLGFRALIVHGSSSKIQDAGMMIHWLDSGLISGNDLVRFFLRQLFWTANLPQIIWPSLRSVRPLEPEARNP